MDNLFQNIAIASACCVGLIEVLKNFFKTEKKWIYALIMIPLSVLNFWAVVCLPTWVTGGILTICVSQIGYQTIVQTLGAIPKALKKD